MENDYLLILTTCPDKQTADQLTEKILHNKAAACVNQLGNVQSSYFWKGEILTDNEIQLFIKTTAENYNNLENIILQNHPYEVPEIIAVKIEQGSRDYLEWIKTSTGGTDV